ARRNRQTTTHDPASVAAVPGLVLRDDGRDWPRLHAAGGDGTRSLRLDRHARLDPGRALGAALDLRRARAVRGIGALAAEGRSAVRVQAPGHARHAPAGALPRRAGVRSETRTAGHAH